MLVNFGPLDHYFVFVNSGPPDHFCRTILVPQTIVVGQSILVLSGTVFNSLAGPDPPGPDLCRYYQAVPIMGFIPFQNLYQASSLCLDPMLQLCTNKTMHAYS